MLSQRGLFRFSQLLLETNWLCYEKFVLLDKRLHLTVHLPLEVRAVLVGCRLAEHVILHGRSVLENNYDKLELHKST